MANKYITLTNLETFLGQLGANYRAAATTYGGVKIDTTAITGTKNYPLVLDTNGVAYVNVPWEAGSYTLESATSTKLGGIKIGYNSGNIKIDTSTDSTFMHAPILLDSDKAYAKISEANTTNPGLMSVADKTKLNGIEAGANAYTLDTATSTKLGGVTIGSNITNTNGKLSLTGANVVAALGYTPSSATTSSGGGMVEKTWNQLRTMRNNGQLSPGTKYRITDYVTTCNSSCGASSMGKVFDIIVEALTTNKLSENAHACLHSNDAYFSNCKLEEWELKYCLDNDKNRFSWANTTSSGRGVIYYMKDEWGNEVPFDFKNIVIDSITLTGGNYPSTTLTGGCVFEGCKLSADKTTVENEREISIEGKAQNNIIKPNIDGGGVQHLNKICCYWVEDNNNGNNIRNNIFDYNCDKINLHNPICCKFESECEYIIVGGPECSHNIFETGCNGIYISLLTLISYQCTEYEQGNPEAYYYGAHNIVHATTCNNNKFSAGCKNIFTNFGCNYNSFGNNCSNILLGCNANYNSFGNNCSFWAFGDYFERNIMSDNNFAIGYNINYYYPLHEPSDPMVQKYCGLFTDGTGNDWEHWPYCDDLISGQYPTYLRSMDYIKGCIFGPNSNAQINTGLRERFMEQDDAPGYYYKIQNFEFKNLINFNALFNTRNTASGNIDDIIPRLDFSEQNPKYFWYYNDNDEGGPTKISRNGAGDIHVGADWDNGDLIHVEE